MTAYRTLKAYMEDAQEERTWSMSTNSEVRANDHTQYSQRTNSLGALMIRRLAAKHA